MTERIKIGEVEVVVTFKDIKNLHLSVHPPYGEVTISSPLIYDLEKVKVYAATKLGWIKKEREKFLNQKREEPREFITQESHYFFGERYLLKVEPSGRNGVEVEGRKLRFFTTDEVDSTHNETVLYSFYRKELRKKLDQLITIHCSLMNLNIPQFKIRKMKTKWGSCATDHRRIWFNIELAKKPTECIEYVVVHELVHLLERHHNKRFVLLMDQYYPNWRVQKYILNELPL